MGFEFLLHGATGHEKLCEGMYGYGYGYEGFYVGYLIMGKTAVINVI